MHVLHVVGARPNFMKVAPVMRAIRRATSWPQTLVHTGQHYDANMSDVFFQQLELPHPDVYLGVGSGSHAQQTAQLLVRLEEALLAQGPEMVLVYGDVNSTMAAALVCAKLHIPVAHVEAGLRSFDRTMPEEINRVVTDQLADLLLTPSVDADDNLRREGIADTRIHRVGNVMIDTLTQLLPLARLPALPLQTPYALVTLHRPSNVDEPGQLAAILQTLQRLSARCQMIFPVHPRTRQKISQHGLLPPVSEKFLLLEPLGYLECLALQQQATLIITDSGGIQEESTWLGVPCLTLRENTERPITLSEGTNRLVGRDCRRLEHEVLRILEGERPARRIPELWDGRASERIVEVLHGWLNRSSTELPPQKTAGHSLQGCCS
ncbi:MAG: UDP-N-acetyl glucosamine 2-epimerase [Planctomycetaceae bacterium]|nr:MAG: UDP-N-acetyl glucosamine 2-epimerase [Planctomycetaceae bacterium]